MLNDNNAIILDQQTRNKNELCSIKTSKEIKKMKEAGQICARILIELGEFIKPGITTISLDKICRDLIENKYKVQIDRSDLEGNDNSNISSFSYSRNHVVAFGELDDVPLQRGDVFGLDISIKKDGWCGDSARAWIVGDEGSQLARTLLAVGYEAMWIGINLVKPGVHIGTISHAVQSYVENQGFSIVKITGHTAHSIGRVHCEGLLIPFYGAQPFTGHILEEGMVITIEPAITIGSGYGRRLSNTMTTMITENEALACYWEHVVAVTNDGFEILDLRNGECYVNPFP